MVNDERGVNDKKVNDERGRSERQRTRTTANERDEQMSCSLVVHLNDGERQIVNDSERDNLF